MEQMRAEQRKHLKAKNAAAAEAAKKVKVSSPPPLPAGPEGPSSSPVNNVVKVNSTTGLDSDQQPSFSEKLESKQKVVDNTQAPPSEQLLIQKQTKDETVIKVAAVKETSKQQSQAKPQPGLVTESIPFCKLSTIRDQAKTEWWNFSPVSRQFQDLGESLV